MVAAVILLVPKVVGNELDVEQFEHLILSLIQMMMILKPASSSGDADELACDYFV